MIRRLVPLLAAACALAGCGIGPGKAVPGGIELRVTRDFGQQQLGSVAHRSAVRQSDTAMRFLQSERRVTTRYGGGFVQSIDGLAGDKSAQHDWFYYVNGAEASVGASDYGLSPGDVEQWDYHDWTATMHVPAIVGAFPEPFVHGLSGRRLPTRLECENESSTACSTVRDALERAGVVVTSSEVGSSGGEKILRVEVSKWPLLRQTGAGRTLSQGPRASGVFARFDAAGRLQLLDTHGRAAGAAPPGSGLVAATQPPGDSIVWLVTGADDAGVARAAAAFTQSTLAGAFAVAATPGGPRRLPVLGGASGP